MTINRMQLFDALLIGSGLMAAAVAFCVLCIKRGIGKISSNYIHFLCSGSSIS